jgi:isopentenyl diphosphate isomerase/L-lactate dehydrogenase-like FMN-dependent dehydrogenase
MRLYGVGGIVISHHHGAFDFAIPPLMFLPKIKKIIGQKMPIFVDCDVENGFDVFKALALGATAVGMGRVMMVSLLENGADG